MKNYLIVFLNLFIFFRANCQEREEFNGPYQDWADIKKQFGAKGNGKDDDTKAFQNAIDSLSNAVTRFNMGKGRYTVIYLPAGTYCISSTLVLKGKIGISILGEDPGRTILKWTGGDKSTMFWANGSAYFKVSRFTWNANGRKEMEGIGVHWKDKWKDAKSQSFAALNIDLSDNYFVGAFKYGISGGSGGGEGTGWNDSEITIRRCLFHSCTEAGIEINGYNALDYWIWDCKFINCSMGIKCTKGNYHVYRSYFSGSSIGDMRNDNCYYTSVRGCYSQNSIGFSTDYGVSCNPFKRIYQDNTVFNVKRFPIEYYHLGKVTMWDNRLGKVKDTSVHYWINTGSWCPGIYEIMSINNKYETPAPFSNNRSPMQNYTVNDSYGVAVKGDSSAFLKTLELTPPKISRKIFEVPEGSTTDEIQSIIGQAMALKGQRPVIHFSTGTYRIERTLHIPAGSDLQLCGDGLLDATIILKGNKSGFINKPMLLVEGPTAITIREIQWGVAGEHDPSTALLFTNTDQKTAEVHMDQLDSRADTSLFTDRLNYLYVEKDNSFFSAGTCIVGGSQMQGKRGTAGVYCFASQFVNLNVQQNGVFMAKDCWWEGSSPVPLDLKGSGTISIDGAMMAPSKEDSMPTIKINDFKGRISLMNMYLQGALLPGKGLDDLSLLVWNIHFYHKMNVLDFYGKGLPYRAAFLGLNAQCFDAKNKDCKTIISIPDKTSKVDGLPVFLDDMTSLTRQSKPVKYKNLPSGVSNIYISRVSIGSMAKGIVLTQ